MKCMVCNLELHHSHGSTVVCPHAFCEHISHVTCLADFFLWQEAANKDNRHDRHALEFIGTQVLPVDGWCPSCGEYTQWIDIVKPLTYRLRVKVPQKKKKEKAAEEVPKTRGRKKKAI